MPNEPSGDGLGEAISHEHKVPQGQRGQQGGAMSAKVPTVATGGRYIEYHPPSVISVTVAPDITKCMQNTGGTVQRSTFKTYKNKSSQ